MKPLFICLVAFFSLFTSCQNSAQSQAEETANAIQSATKTYGPGQVATSENGYEMKATIDGKTWTAKSMMEINESNDDYIRGDDGKTQIGFYMDRDHVRLNKPRKLYKGHSADLAIGDNLMHAVSGEFVITKMDENVIEGTFHFSASSAINGKKAEVTNGTFRVMLNHK